MTTTELGVLKDLHQEGWDLSELLPEPTEEVIAARLEELEVRVTAFEEKRPELSPDLGSGRLLEIQQDYEDLLSRLFVLGYSGSYPGPGSACSV